MWLPGRDVTDKPLISYHEINVILGKQGGPFAQGSHYKGRKLQEIITLEKEVYDRASLVLTFSNWARESMIGDFHLPASKVRVLKPGVNFQILEESSKNYDEPKILFVGRDFERKGGPTLLEAFRKVRREVKKASLIVVGSNPNIDDRGVVVKGLIPRERESELRQLYGEASVFVLPSLFEPFGLVFLEAMAYKLPCIGTNICAMPEIIGDGECGFVVDPGNSEQLAKRLIELLTDGKVMREMGEKGYQKVKAEYTWDKAAREIVGYCRELM
jgi:glycosyltransferase involved in cell wall biosynthesis